MLNRQLFENEIRKLNDSDYENFSEFPESCSLAAQKWSEAFLKYSENIVPASSTLELAKQSSRSVLLGLCSENNNFDNSVQIFTNSLITYAQIMMSGFTSAGFTGVMPTNVLNLFPFFIKAMNNGSAHDLAIGLSNEIDSWFKTGTAININSGVTINWS